MHVRGGYRHQINDERPAGGEAERLLPSPRGHAALAGAHRSRRRLSQRVFDEASHHRGGVGHHHRLRGAFDPLRDVAWRPRRLAQRRLALLLRRLQAPYTPAESEPRS